MFDNQFIEDHKILRSKTFTLKMCGPSDRLGVAGGGGGSDVNVSVTVTVML